jgi:2-amino-4-hydroxy-6-hydroxymethyldihydropteridine diphosphokinase
VTPAWIAFGSNLGDPEVTLARAESLLAARGVVLRRRSRLYASRPEGGAAEPDYANAVLEAESDLDARALLGALQAVEQELGRPRAHAPGPRTCDLDLLALGDTVLDEGPSLVVPHPRLQGRAFVLVPLVELDPQWRHPRLGTTAGEMLAALAAAPGEVRRYEAVPAGTPRD